MSMDSLQKEFQLFLEWKATQQTIATPPSTQVSTDPSKNPEESPVKDNPQNQSSEGGESSAGKQKELVVYSAEEYLSKNKSTPGRKIFRQALKQAAIQAKAWGKLTLRELNAKQVNHIQQEVCKQCPPLEGHKRDINIVLAKSLSEARYYLKRKGTGEVSAQQSVNSKHNQKQTQDKTKKKLKSEKQKSNKMSKQKLFNDVEDNGSSSKRANPREDVVVSFGSRDIAVGTLISQKDDIYCQVSFKEFLVDEQELEDIELPETVKRGKVIKSSFMELEVDDVFLWKATRMRTNVVSNGYVLGSPPKRNMFQETVSGKRNRKPKLHFSE